MAVQVSYPGVYVEEIPSGVRTITGVATSITTFIGWAAQGPTKYAGLVFSWSDFQRIYGGLDPRSPYLGYAVSQFFMNGGNQAYILRLACPDPPPTGLKAAKLATLIMGGLTFTAGTVGPDGLVANADNPGVWAQNYGIAFKKQADPSTRFRVQVVYNPPKAPAPVVVESYENLSITTPDSQGRYVADVINKQSNYVTVAVTSSTIPPDTAATNLTGTPDDDGSVLLPSTDKQLEKQVAAIASAGGILDQIDLFNLLCVPGVIDPPTLSALESYLETRRGFLIADSDPTTTNPSNLAGPPGTGKNAAFYYPWIQAPDPANQNRIANFPPCGFVAGIYARTDGTRGVWKAPAGTDATLAGASGVAVQLNDSQNGRLNPLAVNCIRNFNIYGIVLWGARTMQGNDEIGSEWKYIPVRRTALFIEESLFRALKWVVFEPNDEPLWAEIRLNVGAFMQNLFRQGAFQGQTPADAYFVKCDKETTTQNDINLGIVNIVVGFAPLKPAEFVVIQIQQMAGQIAT
jgi:phage tail sheath protein FI